MMRPKRLSLKRLIHGNEIGMHMTCQQLWGFKKVVTFDNYNKTNSVECIAKVLIPPGTKVIRPKKNVFNNSASEQLRANKMIITGFYDIQTGDRLRLFNANSIYNAHFEYRIGHFKMPDKFDENISKKCTHGLHFYLNLDQAKKYREEYN